MISQEFQAVILAAGRGTRMTELTLGRPKCLLPVGHMPMIINSLAILENSGFNDVIIVTLNSAQNLIQAAISKCEIKIDIVTIPSDAEDWGTAESLQYLISLKKIFTDVLILSSDLYTNGNLDELITVFRQHEASVAALFYEPLQSQILNEMPPGLKNKNKAEKDMIGIDKESSRLVLLASVSDYEESVPLKKSTLRKHPQLSVRSDLIDGHAYLISLRMVKFLSQATASLFRYIKSGAWIAESAVVFLPLGNTTIGVNCLLLIMKSFSTLKGEFLPYLVSKQHTRNPQNLTGKKNETLALLHSHATDINNDENICENSSYNDHRGDLKNIYYNENIRCYGVIANPSTFGIRINSIPSLWFANRLVTEKYRENPVKTESSVNLKSNQVEESYIGGGSTIHEKTSIKHSVIGENSVVLPKSRVINSVVLNRTKFNEGCVVENCVIGNNVVIGPGCELRNCIIGAQHEIPPSTKASFQVFTKSDRLMEI